MPVSAAKPRGVTSQGRGMCDLRVVCFFPLYRASIPAGTLTFQTGSSRRKYQGNRVNKLVMTREHLTLCFSPGKGRTGGCGSAEIGLSSMIDRPNSPHFPPCQHRYLHTIFLPPMMLLLVKNGTGESPELFRGIMFEGFEQGGHGDGTGSLHLASGQAHEEVLGWPGGLTPLAGEVARQEDRRGSRSATV